MMIQSKIKNRIKEEKKYDLSKYKLLKYTEPCYRSGIVVLVTNFEKREGITLNYFGDPPQFGDKRYMNLSDNFSWKSDKEKDNWEPFFDTIEITQTEN